MNGKTYTPTAPQRPAPDPQPAPEPAPQPAPETPPTFTCHSCQQSHPIAADTPEQPAMEPNRPAQRLTVMDPFYLEHYDALAELGLADDPEAWQALDTIRQILAAYGAQTALSR
ncbi:hypothetical protein [Gordonia hirsuta]|nr:hypothetical protein [Gordonia hirsuta]